MDCHQDALKDCTITDPCFLLVCVFCSCDPGLISEVVVPLLSMSNSVLLCISTLLDGGNHYSSCHARCLAFYPPHCQGGACLLPNLLSVLVCAGKMFDLVDSVGRKLFESIAITLVCADCLKTEHRKFVSRKALSSTQTRTNTCACSVCFAAEKYASTRFELDLTLAPMQSPSEGCKDDCRGARG